MSVQVSLPASVEGDPPLISAAVEFDIKRSHVGLESQPWGDSLSAHAVRG